jgi:hypothetical protein
MCRWQRITDLTFSFISTLQLFGPSCLAYLLSESKYFETFWPKQLQSRVYGGIPSAPLSYQARKAWIESASFSVIALWASFLDDLSITQNTRWLNFLFVDFITQ